MPDYIPADDASFAVWAANFSTKLTAAPTSVGLVAGDATTHAALQATWAAAFLAATTPATRTAATIADKDTARVAVEDNARNLAMIIQAFPGTSDGERATFGLTIPQAVVTPVGTPTTRPLLQVKSNASNQHTIHLRDESTPLSRAKPAGVACAEIWVKIGGTAPSSISECQYRGDVTRIPATITYTGSDTGQPAYYFARWKTARGLVGPESPNVLATIAA